MTSALICSHSGERAPPPTTRISSPPICERARSGRRCRAARTRSPRARRGRGAPASWFSARPAKQPRMRSFQRGAIEPDSVGRNSTPSRAGRRLRGEREDVAPAGCPASRPTSCVLPPETKPGFSTSSMPSTACACVSTRRSSSITASSDGTATGSAVPVTSTTTPGAERAGAERRGVLVAGADDDLAAPARARAPRRPRGAARRSRRRRRGSAAARSASRPACPTQLVAPRARRAGRRAASRRRWRGPGTTSPVSQPFRCPPTGASQRARAVVLGLLVAQPHRLRRGVRGVGVQARCARSAPPRPAAAASASDWRVGAPVEPDDRGPQRRAAARPIATSPSTWQASPSIATSSRPTPACVARLAHGLRDRPLPVRRVLLGPAARAGGSSRRARSPSRAPCPRRRRAPPSRSASRRRCRSRRASRSHHRSRGSVSAVASTAPARFELARARLGRATARRRPSARPRSRSPTGTRCRACAVCSTIWPTSSATISAAPPSGSMPWRIRLKRPARRK